MLENEVVYEVDAIINTCVGVEGKRWYQVKWKSMWMKKEHIPSDAVEQYDKPELGKDGNNTVYRILGEKHENGYVEYLICCKNTWEPEEKLTSCSAMISSYWASQSRLLKAVIKVEDESDYYQLQQSNTEHKNKGIPKNDISQFGHAERSDVCVQPTRKTNPIGGIQNSANVNVHTIGCCNIYGFLEKIYNKLLDLEKNIINIEDIPHDHVNKKQFMPEVSMTYGNNDINKNHPREISQDIFMTYGSNDINKNQHREISEDVSTTYVNGDINKKQTREISQDIFMTCGNNDINKNQPREISEDVSMTYGNGDINKKQTREISQDIFMTCGSNDINKNQPREIFQDISSKESSEDSSTDKLRALHEHCKTICDETLNSPVLSIAGETVMHLEISPPEEQMLKLTRMPTQEQRMVQLSDIPAYYGEINPPSDISVSQQTASNICRLLHDSRIIVRHQFALKLVGKLFNTEELATSNCSGALGSSKLDAKRMDYIHKVVFNKFPSETLENQDAAWRDICKRIDSKHRTEKRKYELTFNNKDQIKPMKIFVKEDDL